MGSMIIKHQQETVGAYFFRYGFATVSPVDKIISWA